MISSDELVDRWWFWLVAAAWVVGYVVATSAWDVLALGLVLLVVTALLSIEAHRRVVNEAADATKRAWAQALRRRGERL